MISKSEDITKVALALRSARAARGLTQRQLADQAGLHQAQVARAESGADLRLSTLLELAHAAGLELFLAPRAVAPAITAIIGGGGPRGAQEERPLYALPEED
jgi:transcriptional regulator with XRE-family HTH domain